ncbi:MFS transporter [Arthrobacter sp. NPDC056727]|uniref:MFS transporter n=1 Tax=Arthrobacter sp. NPDC056727 TaxID=3345927 RepID=UPI00366C6832
MQQREESKVSDVDSDIIQPSSAKQIRRVLLSSFAGSLIEWYDFYIFGVASALIFNKIFFPALEPTVGVLASFATLAAGFLARPIGGIIWGHYGDKIGRKKMLVLSMLIMGVCTTLIGFLPTYATIGILAPVILVVLRTAQGIAAGGEWGGAVLIAMEHQNKRRGLASSFPQMGLYGGILLSTGVFTLVTMMPEDVLMSWGWRVPFIASALLVFVGLLIRKGVDESPVFLKALREAEKRDQQKAPLIEVLRQPRNLILATSLTIGPFVISSIYSTFAAAYGAQIGFGRTEMSTMVLVGSVVGFLFQPVFGALSDYIGRKGIFIAGLLVQAGGVWYLFEGMNAHASGGVFIATVIVNFGHSMCYSPTAAWIGELFPTHLRYTGASLGYQLAGSLGGLTPLICSALLVGAGGPPNTLSIVLFSALANGIALVAALVARETAKSALVD